ncbi:hypothetical protein NDA15_001827 [Ustilago hordei]|nr:hypothetical protein NDA15_001827 [Ustilago hordei]
MKLSGMFRIGFVAAIVTALILLPSCIASGSSGKAKYLKFDGNNIVDDRTLDEKARTYRDVPFFYSERPHFKTPLYSINTPTATVERALRDHQSVGIVDVRKGQARLIQVVKDRYESYLEQHLFPDDVSELIKLFQLDDNLHRLRNTIRASDTNMKPPREESMESIPHVNDKPILTQGSEDFHHMLHASYTDSRKFYYVRPGQDAILVDPRTNEVISDLEVSEREKIQHALTEYSAAKQDYGKTIASVIWGRPIKAMAYHKGGRTSHIPLTEYPRLTYGDTRDNMMLKLQQNGRFRIYRKIDRKKYAYKVKVKNPGANEGEYLEVYVKPLSRLERNQERLLALAGKIELPWVAKLRASHRR